MRTRVLAAMLALSMTLVLTGCLPGPPDEPPSIRGTITTITLNADGLGSMLVEGPIADGTTFDRAAVRVTEDTEILLKGADGWGRFAFDALSEGDTVEVWFTGPVAESYPVQATAGTLVRIP